MATFYANGGLTTKPGSLFQRQGLSLRLVPGDASTPFDPAKLPPYMHIAKLGFTTLQIAPRVWCDSAAAQKEK